MADTPEKQQDYNSAKADREKYFTYEPCSGTSSSVQPCIEKDKFKIVELVEVVKHKGKEITRPWRARNQYIHCHENLDPADPHPEYGCCIWLKARVEWISGSMCRKLDGRIIKWSYKSGARNRTNLSGENKEGFDKRGGSTTKETCTDSEGWTPVVEFYLSDPVDNWRPLIPNAVPTRRRRLSQYDGDTFEIIATDENNESLRTGLLTVIGLIDWLPGMDQMPDNNIATLRALQSLPDGIVLHSGESGPGVAEWLARSALSCHFLWSTTYGGMVQQVPLALRASHAGARGNHWWGYEWPGPWNENPRS